MSRLQCNGCGGIYHQATADGLLYFHVCPPIVFVTAQLANGTRLERAREQWRGVELVASRDAFDARVNEGADPATLAIEISSRREQRPGHRDENTRPGTTSDAHTREIVSEGAGVHPVPDVGPLSTS